MKRHNIGFLVFAAIFLAFLILAPGSVWANVEPCPCALSPCEEDDEGASWIFEPSYYSHDRETGQRVAQFAPLPKVYLPYDPTYRESGFRYTQQILRGAQGSVDALHLVQTWGRGEAIRPYGEWLYPYRAGATPYGPWGNPQGPWTLPFDSWVNPYGLGRLPNPPWPVFPTPLPGPVPFGNINAPPASAIGNGPVSFGNLNAPPAPGLGNGAIPFGNSVPSLENGEEEE